MSILLSGNIINCLEHEVGRKNIHSIFFKDEERNNLASKRKEDKHKTEFIENTKECFY